MEVGRRLISSIASSDRPQAEVDVSALVRQLLLHDNVVLQSRRFQEFPKLLAAFGLRGVSTLLHSPALTLAADLVSMADATPLMDDQRLIGPSHFKFGLLRVTDESFVQNSIEMLRPRVDLTRQQFNDLAVTLEERRRPLPKEFQDVVTEELNNDIRQRKDLIELALRKFSDRELPDLRLRIDEVASGVFHIDTGLQAEGVDAEEERRMITRAIFAVSTVDLSLSTMAAFDGIGGMPEEHAPVMQKKMSLVTQLIGDPTTQQKRFERVLDIREMPEFAIEYGEKRVDVDRLLKTRETSECLEFRQWLASTDEMSDKDINHFFGSMSAGLGLAIRSKAGRAIRFLASSGIGLPTAVGIGISALDTFVLEKLLPVKGAVTFLNRMYPDLFRDREKVKEE